MNEAKPCPWCGAKQDMIEGEVDDRSDRRNIRCGNCGQRGPFAKGENAALAEWNHRPIEDALIDAASAVLDQIDYLQNLWGKEGVTNTLADRLRTAIESAKP